MTGLIFLTVILIILAAGVSVALIWQYVRMKCNGTNWKYQLPMVVFFTCWNMVSIANCIMRLIDLM